jgi:hypothetical protein
MAGEELTAVFSVDIRADVPRVWSELFRNGVPHHPMFGTYLHGELVAGAVLSYRDKSEAHTFVLGKVLEVDPPTRLVHTFRFSMIDDEPTLVQWQLKPHGDGTRVTVTHSRFTGKTKTYKSVETSWPKILGLYKQLIETGKVPLGTRLSNGMMSAMSFMLPAAARTKTAMSKALDVG